MEKRKEEILKILSKSDTPMKGDKLGEIFGVTRQVIVQDIALLRAQGIEIFATNRGYLLPKEDKGLLKKVVVEHEGTEEMEDELNIIVDYGGIVKDVIVDHPVYGELRGLLELYNRKDVQDFMKEVRENNATPLSHLTEGVHIHTIEVKEESIFENIRKALSEKGYLTK